jgi:hypothetical protein
MGPSELFSRFCCCINRIIHFQKINRIITNIWVLYYSLCSPVATSRPGAPGIPTGESDSTFRASWPTSWRLDFSSQLVVDLVPCATQASPRPIRNPKTSSCFLLPDASAVRASPLPLSSTAAGLPLSSAAAAAALPLSSAAAVATPRRPPPLLSSSPAPSPPLLSSSPAPSPAVQRPLCLKHKAGQLS